MEEVLEKSFLTDLFKGTTPELPARDHLPSRQAGGDGDPKLYSFCLGYLDSMLCRHGTPDRRSLWVVRIKKWGPFHAPVGGTRGYLAPSQANRTNSAGGGRGGGPCIGYLSDETGNQDGGLDHRVAVHGE